MPLALGGLVRPIGIIHRKGKRLTPAVARFIDVLQKAGDGDGSRAPGGRGTAMMPMDRGAAGLPVSGRSERYQAPGGVCHNLAMLDLWVPCAPCAPERVTPCRRYPADHRAGPFRASSDARRVRNR